MGPRGDRSRSSDADPRPASEWREAVVREERRGELLAAFDLAQRGLVEHPDDLLLKHRAVLALARAGATDEAASRYAEYGLDRYEDEDIAALGGRIAKDFALREEGEERRRLAAGAARRYAAVFRRTGGYYPAINAATLWLVAGDQGRARELAAVVLGLLSAADKQSYYVAASEAEAQLLLGHQAAAQAALERAAAINDGDFGALASTRRQLRVICATLAIDPAILRPLCGPSVVFFCGHRIAGEGQPGGLPADAEARCAAAISEVVGSRPAGFAYGALAGGADILWAEALLARGSELYVVLPFAVDEFIKSSVAPCGFGWVERFGRLLGAAAEVRYATDDALLGDDVLFRYGGELGMGLALLRARYLDAEARQFALWDGGPPAGAAGTAFDVATWRSSGHPATIVSPEGRIANCEPGVTPIAPSVGMPAPNRRQPRRDHSERAVRAMLFGDFRGFSKLTDEQLPRFTERILGTVAEVVRAHRDQVLYRNTWGDAVYLVLTDVAAAADCALDFQEALAAIDLSSEDLPDHLALRLGGHVGPVFQAYDPVLENDGFMGSHVSRTARIEPVAPPGTVYVTEAFAAALVLAANRDMTCDYVGHMSAAKGYGRLRMYRLRRTAGGDDWRP